VINFASDRADYTGDENELKPWRVAKFDFHVSRRPRLTAQWEMT